MTVRGWQAVSSLTLEERSAELARLPSDEREAMPEGDVSARSIESRSAATLVRLAKYSTATSVRARAFYLEQPTPVTVKIILGKSAEQARLTREITIRETLSSAVHLPAPPMLESHTGAGFSYLVEPVLYGRHAHDPATKQHVALRMVSSLIRFHEDVGTSDDVVVCHPDLLDRFERLMTSAVWPHDTALLIAHARRLVADATPIPFGWGHGDLGFSNVIITDSGEPQLIDWEHSGRMPVAADLAKLAAMSPDQDEVVARVLTESAGGTLAERPACRSLADQLALMILRELSWWESRRTRAEAAGRLTPYERGIRRRLRLLESLTRAS